MRDLCADEIELVSGGEGGDISSGGYGGFADITVYGSSPGFAYDYMSMGSPSSFLGGSYSYAGGFGLFGASGISGTVTDTSPAYPADWVDNDGDGTPDGPYQPPIVVTATAQQLEWADYAYDKAEWDLYVANNALGTAGTAWGIAGLPYGTAVALAGWGVQIAQTPEVQRSIIDANAHLIYENIEALGSIWAYENLIYQYQYNPYQ